MPTYDDYAFAQRHYRETELQKKPGQDFCDKYGWRLHSDFDEIQRPDKITYMNGSVYRTHSNSCGIKAKESVASYGLNLVVRLSL